jgi:predicted acylesterase/phospholipase RssA
MRGSIALALNCISSAQSFRAFASTNCLDRLRMIRQFWGRSVELKYCDIVMKGGITSGVVYPYTITELATEYCFKSIGGTSAGAIAATLTAAAELGRREGHVRSFDVIKELPAELGREHFLLDLFQPSPESRKVFKVFLSGLRSGTAASGLFAALFALIANFWLALLVGLVLGLIVPILLWLLLRGPVATYFVLGALWVALLVAVSILFSVSRTVLKSLGSGGFGMCSGISVSGSSKQPALTDWLHHKIQVAAGRKPGAAPVTFGDLWAAKPYPGEEARTELAINLQVVTTDLTEGRPHTLPVEFRGFYFNPEEFAALFPTDVLQFMVSNDRSSETEGAHAQSARNVLSPDGKELVRFPEGSQLPILVAARMSLSFPILLKAVPLYAIDFSLANNQRRDEKEEPYIAERCWFSDGGICSNFPMHFFDSPLPRWPTFGINLKAPHPDHDKDESDFVWLPTKPGSGRQLAWNRFDSGSDWSRILGFFGAIINTMQNWRDNIQATAAGYRDRIVHVSLRPNEGGLNLNMPPELISRLSERGRTAGTLLRTTFSFSEHMWVRYRLTMCSIHDYLRRLDNSWRNPVPQDDLGREYINGQKSPPLTGKNRGAVEELRRNLLQLASVFQNWIGDPCEGAPRPKAELRGQPKY